MADAKKLMHRVKKDGVELLLPTMSSLSIDNRGCLIPVEECEKLLENGYPYFSLGHYKMPFNASQMTLKPDVDTYVQLPWKPQVAWMTGILHENGKPSTQCPRQKLFEMQNKAKTLGFMMKSGLELEFSLLDKEKFAPADSREYNLMECYHDPLESMQKVDFLREINAVLKNQGWKPYMIEHEGIPGQYEINYDFAEAVTSADRMAFFKFLVKDVAKKYGYRSSFMPYPFAGSLAGNGLHINISLWDLKGENNLFPDKQSEVGVSELAQHFMAGILEHMEALAAILCPTVNSYKRLYGTPFSEGFPPSVSWGHDNHLSMIRLPNNERMELRLADSAANPYLSQAAVLAAGIDGIERKLTLNPAQQIEEDVISRKTEKFMDLRKIPNSLFETCQFLKNDEVLIKQLGSDMVDGFLFVKNMEHTFSLKKITDFEKSLVEDY